MSKNSWKDNNILLKESQQNDISWPSNISKDTPVSVRVERELYRGTTNAWTKVISSYGQACSTLEKMYYKYDNPYKKFKVNTGTCYGKPEIYFYFYVDGFTFRFWMSPISKEDYDSFIRNLDDLEHYPYLPQPSGKNKVSEVWSV